MVSIEDNEGDLLIEKNSAIFNSNGLAEIKKNKGSVQVDIVKS